jgi:hypothetical protein
MADQWMIRGNEYANCNCDYGCPCQFNAPSTHGRCEAVFGGQIQEGFFNDTRLDGLNWLMMAQWPGEIAEGNGKQQAIIDERADADQREALRKILHGESTAPGATHFFVYNSMVSEVLDPIYAPVEVDFDLEARTGRLFSPGLVESTGTPIINPHTGGEHHAQIHLPNGFGYTMAEMGSGVSKTTGAIQLDLTDTYGQFNEMHMNQDGVIR